MTELQRTLNSLVEPSALRRGVLAARAPDTRMAGASAVYMGDAFLYQETRARDVVRVIIADLPRQLHAMRRCRRGLTEDEITVAYGARWAGSDTQDIL